MILDRLIHPDTRAVWAARLGLYVLMVVLAAVAAQFLTVVT
jgi:hypothetical protein